MAGSVSHRRLLLVSTNYAPEHAGTSRYATQIAEHWAAAGAEVHVLTGLPHYPAWRLDPAYADVRATREERCGVSVHRRRHSVPSRQTAPRRALFEMSLLRGALSGAPDIGRPDAVAAQMPSLAAGVVGARLAARHGVPFVPVVRNLLGGRTAAAGLVERYALRRAALVGVTHETLVAGVAAMGVPEQRIRLVQNWSLIPGPTRPREQMRALLGWRPGQTVLLYTGDMGAGRGLDVLVEAARLDPTLRVVLMGEGARRDALRTMAGGLPNLDFAPLAAESEFPDVLGAADVLAVADPAVPPELTSYFAAGRPVVAAVPADSGTAREIARAGAGAVVPPEEPAALLAAVRALAADDAAAAQARSYATTHLTPSAGLARIDALLAEALTLAPPAPPHSTPGAPARPAAPPAVASRVPAEPQAPPAPVVAPTVGAEAAASAAPVAAEAAALVLADGDAAARVVAQSASTEAASGLPVEPQAPPAPLDTPTVGAEAAVPPVPVEGDAPEPAAAGAGEPGASEPAALLPAGPVVDSADSDVNAAARVPAEPQASPASVEAPTVGDEGAAEAAESDADAASGGSGEPQASPASVGADPGSA